MYASPKTFWGGGLLHFTEGSILYWHRIENNIIPYLVGELERQQLERVGVFLPQDNRLGRLVPAPVQLLVEHHLADDGVSLALLHVEHLAQRRQAEGLVVR